MNCLSRVKLIILLYLISFFSLGAADIWLEAESPTSRPELAEGVSFSAWGNRDVFSGEALSISIPDKKTADLLGETGKTLRYDFEINEPGNYHLWGRIGYEWVRSPFEWRIGNGEWQELSNRIATRDIVPIQTWNELAWLEFGKQQLAAGKHSLELRFKARTIEKKRGNNVEKVPDRCLFAADCFLLTTEKFHPNGKYKPGEAFQDELQQEAATKVFEITTAEPGKRAVSPLSGAWEIADWTEWEGVDENSRLKGERELPPMDALSWYGTKVPGDVKEGYPERGFWHRVVMRTRFAVPKENAGRSFILDFPDFGMIATVFVNGKMCGWTKNCYTAWQCDISDAVKAGEENTLVMVFKDVYYAIRPDEKRDLDQTLGCRSYFNLPPDMVGGNQGVTMRFDMPVKGTRACGILARPTLITAGSVYAEDVFVKPSVSKKNIELEITLKNAGKAAAEVSVEHEIIPWNNGQGGAAELKFPAQKMQLPADSEKVANFAENWADPKLWFPDNPHLYWVITRISQNGKVIDEKRTRFGFREISWTGKQFRINGVPWSMWADVHYGKTPRETVKMCKESGMNMVRFWRFGGWGDMSRRETLNLFDETGLLVRSSGIFDGQHASYDLKNNPGLYENWYEQMKAWIREERNHPSIFIWSIENEIVFINSWNLGGWKIAEPLIRKGAEIVEAMDPTRPTMVDGGKCLMDNSMPVNGCHYSDLPNRDLPDAAYDYRVWENYKNHGDWAINMDRPIFHGECFYANGWDPPKFSEIGGERCFLGIGETLAARSLYARMITEGYRWAGLGAWHMWFGSAERNYYQAFKPVAAFTREWNWTFGSGENFSRTVGVFNTTSRKDPVELNWELEIGGKKIASGKENCSVPPGNKKIITVETRLPKVKERTDGVLTLICKRGDEIVFEDSKPLAVIPTASVAKPNLNAAQLQVLDPQGNVAARLKKRQIQFTPVRSLAEAKAGGVLIVGADAVSADMAADTNWLRLAAQGTRVMVLDQAHPLRYQALPSNLRISQFSGRIAFCEDLTHPIFDGLTQDDFFTWGIEDKALVYRNAYQKASRGARSLVQCDERLNYTAMAESTVNDGLMLLCQVPVGTRLTDNAVAQRIFDNMLNYAADYQPVRNETAVCLGKDVLRNSLMNELGLKFDRVDDPLKALSGKWQIAIIDASPENLKTLAANRKTLDDFCEKGGWLMLWGLTPDGLAEYNRIVGYDHVIRPFSMEKVHFPTPRDALVSGLTLRDVVMDTGQKIFHFMSLMWPDEEAWTYAVDYDDIGPFCKLPSWQELGKPEAPAKGWDHDPNNLFNNYTAADTWRLSYTMIIDRGDKTKFTLHLPKEEELVNFAIVPNDIYWKIKKIDFYFDDDPEPFRIDVQPIRQRQDFKIDGRKAKSITIDLVEFEKSHERAVTGIDNLWLNVKRGESFRENVRPLLNIGVLMRYNRGKGGILLNQLNIVKQEKLPLNAEKKKNIMKVLLRNLGGIFSGGELIVAGSDLDYQPLKPNPDHYTAYLDHSGKPAWFQGNYDLSSLPQGILDLNGVEYYVYDFTTSPVPKVAMLKGHGSQVKNSEIKGIKVEQQADALFFLHTANGNPDRLNGEISKRRRDASRKGLPFEPIVIFKYLVNYADGKIEEVPVEWGEGISHWLSETPQALPQAAVAWSAKPAADADKQAVVYGMQWNNPRPDIEIKSIDMIMEKNGERYAAPAMLAITAAKKRK